MAMATHVEPSNGVQARGKHYFSMWQTLFEIDTKYFPIKLIGRGAYGVVCSAINRGTNKKVAIKKINYVFGRLSESWHCQRRAMLSSTAEGEVIVGENNVSKDLRV